MYDVDTLLKTAVDETSHVWEVEIFPVKDLFKGYLWNRIPSRLLLCSIQREKLRCIHQTPLL